MGSQTIAEAIARQEWMDDVIDPLQSGIRDLFSGEVGPQLKDALHGTWLGHPLHPVLTDIPVGAWTVSLVLDAVESATGNEGVGKASDAAVAVGLAGALGAAVTGATDWSETGGPARKIGLVHAGLNIVATLCYATSLGLRQSKKTRQTGIALSWLGYAISGASAYLGGHLVFSEQIGVDHTATPDQGQPSDFTPVIDLDALRDDTPTRVDAGDAAILLVKRGPRIFAISHTCPHLGAPLSEGKLVGESIECPWHASRLALEDGRVVCGPTTFPARVYDVRIREGKVEVKART